MDRTQLHLSRTAVWGFLAAAFRRPAEPVQDLARDAVPAAQALGLTAGLPGPPPSPAEYDALFGHIARGPVPAHESEYGEARGMRFSHEISDLQGFYRAFGLQPSRQMRERADHVAVECEFMAFLALKEAFAVENDGEEKADLCRDASRKFLAEHLGRFGRALATRVRERARHPFLIAAATLLDQIVLADCRRFDVTAGPGELALREDAGTPEDACISCSKFTGTPQ